jgi:hypothetical protein
VTFTPKCAKIQACRKPQWVLTNFVQQKEIANG